MTLCILWDPVHLSDQWFSALQEMSQVQFGGRVFASQASDCAREKCDRKVSVGGGVAQRLFARRQFVPAGSIADSCFVAKNRRSASAFMEVLELTPREREQSDMSYDVDVEDQVIAQRLLEAEVEEDSGGEDGPSTSEEEDLFDRMGLAMVGGFNKVFESVKRVAVSEETETMLADVHQIANTLLKSEYNSAQILAAVRILSGFRSNRPTLTNIPSGDIKMLKHAFYWWQFAEAAFGWALVHGIKFEAGFVGFAQGAVTSNDEVLMKYCKLERDCIKHTQWDSKACMPGNFVAVDHRTKSVLWSIRGTFGMSDILTDLVAHSVPFLCPEHVAHKGMVKCVDGLVERVWPIVVKVMADNPGYWLVTTGHSMGAAVASMLAMWVRHTHPEVAVVCWAYACPPCVSLSLSETTRDYIFGLAFGDDVITRLSLESLAMFKRRLQYVLAEGPGFWKSVTQGLAASAQVEERLTQMGVLVGDRWAFELEMERDYATHSKRLWPPLRQLYLYEVNDQVVAEESDCKQFHSIVLSAKLFNHHLPMSYDKALIRLIKQLKLEEMEMTMHNEAPEKIAMTES